MKPPLHHEEVHLRDYLYILKKRRSLIFFFALFVFVAAIFITYKETILFRAIATILIERENPNIVDFKEVMSIDGATSEYYQTQYQMLKSRTLIEKLIQKENLENDSFILSMRRGRLRQLLSKYQSRLPVWLGGFLEKPRLTDIFIEHMLRIDPQRNSRLVSISVLHPESERSAELTNRLVELFIERNLEERYLISQRASQLLSEQLIELKEKVAGAEKNLQAYKEKHGLINIPSIREKDQFIQEAKLELVKLQAEEAKLSKRYLPAHPKMISIRSQIEGLQEKINEEEEKTLALSGVAIEYSELEREAETSRRVYAALLDRLEETQSAAQAQASNIMIVDQAIAPPRPFKPRPFLNMLVAFFMGIIGGILLAFFAEYLDPTVRVPDDIEKGLGLDVFGIIPRVSRGWKKGPVQGELFISAKQHSTIAESFRALRTALLFKLRGQTGCRMVLITSANPSEGKSTISLNLAAAFEQNNLRVLLIDCDLRKPKLHKLFDVSQESGLSDILESNLSLSAAVHENIGELGFDFLSCGTASHHPTEILGSDKMKDVLKDIKESYDMVVIDTPPFHAVADVAVINEFVDATVVVAKYHSTHRRHLQDVRRSLNEEGKKVLGVAINQVGVREKDYYYHQYYYYGYGDSQPKK